MKSIIYSSILLSSVAHCSTSIISISNLSDGDEFPILVNGIGIQEGQGSIAIGTFTDSSIFSNITSSNDILSNFFQFNTETSFNPTTSTQIGGFGLDEGFFAIDVEGDMLTTGDAFVGNTAFFVFGDANTLSTSTAFAVVQTGTTFMADSGTTPGSLFGVVASEESTLLFGEFVDYTPSATNSSVLGDLANSQGINLIAPVPIPEPSSSVLIGLGSLALLSRRKR